MAPTKSVFQHYNNNKTKEEKRTQKNNKQTNRIKIKNLKKRTKTQSQINVKTQLEL